MRALILADGDPPDQALLERLRAAADTFVATDGAANRLVGAGPQPHVVLGDFDSLDQHARSALGSTAFVHLDGQEDCDLEKAVRYTLDLGARDITVAGAWGGRIDHALTALSVLVKYHTRAHMRLLDGRSVVRVVSDDALEIHGAPGDTLSLVAFSSVCSVRLDGVRWPLHGERLEPGSRGVSNCLTGTRARLVVDGGPVVVVHLPAPGARESG